MKKIVKSLTAVLCAVLTLGFTACQRDYEDLIIGSWEVVGCTITETVDGQSSTRTEALPVGYSETCTFNKDNTFVGKRTGGGGSDTYQGTYSLSDDQLTIAVNSGWQDDEGEWHSTVDTETATIKNLDKKELVMVWTETEGANYTYSVEYKLKRM